MLAARFVPAQPACLLPAHESLEANFMMFSIPPTAFLLSMRLGPSARYGPN